MADVEWPGENLYVKAIHHPDPAERADAFRRFIEREMDDVHGRLTDHQNDDGSVREEASAAWNYEKGALDKLRLLHAIAIQRTVVAEQPEESGAEKNDDEWVRDMAVRDAVNGSVAYSRSEAYAAFSNEDGTVDVYEHVETVDPDEI